MNLGLDGRLAVVTGGSRGIGFATARILAEEGCDVVVVARHLQPLQDAAKQIASATGQRAFAIAADTANDESVAAMAAVVNGDLGGGDILVNAAATPSVVPFADSDLPNELNVKLQGYLRCIRALSPAMINKGWGRIVNVAGLAARQTGSITSSVRNAAVVAMTKNLADELGPSGITVNVIHPGTTKTETFADQLARRAAQMKTTPQALEADLAARVAIGRLLSAEEVAWVIAFLASKRGLAINGDIVVASGGIRGPIFA